MSESALYNKIGFKYNETRCADRYLTKCFQNFLNPQENENYLDAGCGTGNYTRALSSDKYQFYGIDPSDLMLGKARQPKSRVIWQKSDAENLPFENEFFGGAIASLTIHHWKDLHQAFGEINRVLKPHGKFVLFTAFPEQMENYWLNHYFPQMMRDSTKQMPAFSAVKESLKNAGFEITKRESYFIRDDLQDHFLYCGKNRPELYLQADIQKGISSFSNLANKTEVKNGLRRLAEDIETDKISEVINNYQSLEGDYAFIVADNKSQKLN